MGETEGFTIADHMATLRKHAFRDFTDCVLANNASLEFGSDVLGKPVIDDGRSVQPARLEMDDLTDGIKPTQPNSIKLGDAVMNVYRKAEESKDATLGPWSILSCD